MFAQIFLIRRVVKFRVKKSNKLQFGTELVSGLFSKFMTSYKDQADVEGVICSFTFEDQVTLVWGAGVK